MAVMSVEEENLLPARRDMVETQLRARGISDRAVLDAFMEIPRELFVPAEFRHETYGDHPIQIGHGQTISQPYVTALMVQELRPSRSSRVLDIGAGSGYQTAILAKLAGHVYAVERIEALTTQAAQSLAAVNADNVTLRTGDGTLGWPEKAPFDGIICGAAAPQVPKPWLDQLADGGRIVLPVGGHNSQIIQVIEKHGSGIRKRELCAVRFVKLIGQEGWPA